LPPATPATPSHARLFAQYQRLSAGLPSDGSAQTLSLAEMAQRLCCGERNARLLLQRMQALGWLRWTAGRGRGRLSRLCLLRAAEGLQLERLQSLLAAGQLEAAFEGLPAQGREQLRQSLPHFLGASPAGGLRIPFYRPLHALDPIQVNRRTEVHMLRQIGAGLCEFEREPGQIVTALAHHWSVEAGGCHWQFHLRPGLRFHDGRPLRVEDVVQTLTRLRDSPGPYQALYQHLREIAASGPWCVQITLAWPDALLLNRLAHHAAIILPAQDWQRADFARLPVAAGPFRLQLNNDYRARLRAFEGFYRERPLLDEIELWVVPQDSPLPRVDVQLGHGRPAPAGWQRLSQLEQGCDFLLLNPAHAAFASAEARLALAAWLRQELVLEEPGRKSPARGYLPGWQHVPPRSSAPVATPRLRGPLRLITYQLPSHIELAERIAALCRRAGASPQLRVLPYPEFARMDWVAETDVVISGEVMGEDLDFGLYSGLVSDALFHIWLQPALRAELHALLDRARSEPDAEQRHALLAEGYARVCAAGQLLPLRHSQQGLEHDPRLGGVQLAVCGWMPFRQLWLREATGEAAKV